MSGFVVKPNLPINAKVLLLGQKYSDILENPLKRLDIEPVFVPDNSSVDSRLAGHADLSVFHLGGEKCLLAAELKGSAFEEKLKEIGLKLSFLEKNLDEKYPDDAALNACAVGNVLIYNRSSASGQIVDFFTNANGVMVQTKQGYTKCSVCVVDERSIITADRGIAAIAECVGLDVLLISQGYVNLPGFDYGFIGGATFKLSADKLAFTGSLDAHPDKIRILYFLDYKGVKPVFLTDLPVFDIGGAIPIIENE